MSKLMEEFLGNLRDKKIMARIQMFQYKCLFYNVFPKFVQFKVSSITFTKTKLYQECETNILKHELKQLDDKFQKL